MVVPRDLGSYRTKTNDEIENGDERCCEEVYERVYRRNGPAVFMGYCLREFEHDGPCRVTPYDNEGPL